MTQITASGHILFTLFSFALGACIGSFLNVAVGRFPADAPEERWGWLRRLWSPPSHCPKCGHTLAWYDNIPVFGWIFLRGRCRYCAKPISMRYPIVETVTGAIFALYYLLIFLGGFGPAVVRVSDWGQVVRGPALQQVVGAWPDYALGLFLLYLFLLAALLVASLIDAELYVIPASLPWLVAAVACVAHALLDHPTLPGSVNVSGFVGALSAGAGVGLLVSLVLLYRGWLPLSFPHGEPMLEVDRPAAEAEITRARREGQAIPNLPPVYSKKQIRLEIAKEMRFLMPPLLGAGIVGLLYLLSPSIAGGFDRLMSYAWLSGFLGALWGALIGAAIIWLTRILGTLAFGRVAMGLGDVHLMFGVGAVIGAGPTVMTFFLAPFLGILVALYMLLARTKRELPYGPYLSLATGFVLLFYVQIAEFLQLNTAAAGLVMLLKRLF